MRHLKSIALLSTLILSNVAFAAESSATLSLNNTSIDTLTAGNVGAFTWDVKDNVADVLSRTGSLSWTTPASGETDRTIKVSLADDLPTNVKTLKIVAGTVTGTGTPGTEVSVSTTDQPLISGIAAYSEGTSQLTYTFDVDGKGFTSNEAIIVNFTMTSDQ